MTITVTGVCSVLFALRDAGLPLAFLEAIPLADIGLGWVLPAIAGAAVGVLASPHRP